MIEPVQIDEIVRFVKAKFPYLKWEVIKRFDELIVETKINANQSIVLHPHRYNEDYYNNGIYTVSYWFENKKEQSGHGGGMNTWEELQMWMSRDLEELHIIPTETQLSIFDL